jgi:phosphonate transport system substrate-binding protein
MTPGKCSRRLALAALLGWRLSTDLLHAADTGPPIRLAISENVVGEINLNDARLALQLWIKRLRETVNVVLEPKLFNTTQEIVERTEKGQLDAVGINVLEYRQVASLMDPSQLLVDSAEGGTEQYLLLAKTSSFRQLGDLKGRRLRMLKTPKMCLAASWLSTVLDEGHWGVPEQFFSSIEADGKFSRTVLPVFFGQTDCCLTSRRGFDTMCELNPQVGKELGVLAASPALTVAFYIFRKDFRAVQRERIIQAISGLRNSPGGDELATMFQFSHLAVRDAGCLASALSLLETADRVRTRQAARGRK